MYVLVVNRVLSVELLLLGMPDDTTVVVIRILKS